MSYFKVVNAGQGQMTKLVTAQGFVSDVLRKYVKRLVESLPEPLSVVYLTNSGSEANDLALRFFTFAPYINVSKIFTLRIFYNLFSLHLQLRKGLRIIYS